MNALFQVNITGISKNNQPNIGSQVTITGSGFTRADKGGAVNFGGIGCPSGTFSVHSDTQITATIPSQCPSGPTLVQVTVPNKTGSNKYQYTLVEPSNSGQPGAQLIIDLTTTDLPSDTPVYVYIIGEVISSIDQSVSFYYVPNDGVGIPKKMSLADNTIPANTFPNMMSLPLSAQQAIAPNYPDAWADYSIPVPVGENLILGLGLINTTNIPGLGTGVSAFSGRVYISVGVPILPFTARSNGYTAPVFAAPPGNLTFFDWIEFSYDSEGNFNGNTTQVNQFGLPLTLIGTSLGGGTFSQGALNQPSSTILNKIAQAKPPFGGNGAVVLVPDGASSAYPLGITNLRAISPVTNSVTPTNLINTYFDQDIRTAYTYWQTTPLVTHDTTTAYFTGIVITDNNGIPIPPNYPTGSLAFYEGNYPTLAALVKAVNGGLLPSFFLTGQTQSDQITEQITSNDIWQCANSLASGSAAQLNVGKMIAAAFNRGVMVNNGSVTTYLDDSTCSPAVSSFYPIGSNYNQWSQWFHQYNTNGLAYGFPYDDVCNQNPSIPPPGSTLVAESIRIQLGKILG